MAAFAKSWRRESASPLVPSGVSFAKREPRLRVFLGGPTGGVLCYGTSPASRNRRLRTHNECNQNANQVRK
jgi:hypothetical protein